MNITDDDDNSSMNITDDDDDEPDIVLEKSGVLDIDCTLVFDCNSVNYACCSIALGWVDDLIEDTWCR